MCRNIKQRYNCEPHATSAEVQAAAAQFVRKISGFQKPSAANEAAFKRAIQDIAHASHHLLEDQLHSMRCNRCLSANVADPSSPWLMAR